MKKPSLYIEIIRKFLPESRVKLFCGADWGRETKACKDIVQTGGTTLEQLLSLDKPPFQINSIHWFKTANGKKYIQDWHERQKKNTHLSNQISNRTVVTYKLEDAAVDSGAVSKPRTLLDFLSYGKTKTRRDS